MSTCISFHGEFGSHTLDDAYTCTLCGVLDEDAMTAELRDLREERDALRVGIQAIIDDMAPRQGRVSIVGKQVMANRLSELLDRTSITGE